MYYIYKITNLTNNKHYIGLTNNIERRRSRHFCDLAHNRHDNHYLQKEFNIYGPSQFDFSVIFYGDVTYEEISEKERFYISEYDSYRNGYNQNEGGNFGPSNGGSRLSRSDIMCILAINEFSTGRSGQVLADLYGTTRTTIARIVKGVNHCQYHAEYKNLSIQERLDIFTITEQSHLMNETIHQSNGLHSLRKLTDEQCFMIYLNSELKLISFKELSRMFKVRDGVVYSIRDHLTYKDVYCKYEKLTREEKEKIATLFGNK